MSVVRHTRTWQMRDLCIMMHVMTIPTCVLECAMSLHDSYSKAYMLPFRDEHTTPCEWAYFIELWGY